MTDRIHITFTPPGESETLFSLGAGTYYILHRSIDKKRVRKVIDKLVREINYRDQVIELLTRNLKLKNDELNAEKFKDTSPEQFLEQFKQEKL